MNYNTREEVKKKILTTTIGSLARFEKYFGFLWGQNKEYLTPQEEKMLDLWEEARHEILNLGNKQMRSIDNFSDVTKYKYNFKIQQPGDNYNEN
jgi:hypothetical protein